MEYVELGKTGLFASKAGLGCGGHSRLGLEKSGLRHAMGMVRQAYEAGVNFFDTAAAYGTQEAVGKGLAGLDRASFILSTKFPYQNADGSVRSPKELKESLDESLSQLQSGFVDFYFLHGLRPEDYREAAEKLCPAMEKAKKEGKIRFLGVSELFNADPSHKMLETAIPEGLFDICMVGYNLLNQSAERQVFPLARKHGVATLGMFAVRSALSNPSEMDKSLDAIYRAGQAERALVEKNGALSFLVREGHASSLTEAAYRFVSSSGGIDVALTGTGSPAHLRENLESISMPALPKEALERVREMFGRVDSVTGESIGRTGPVPPARPSQ
jgi:aryl-alcohol dehydrogenase-like predicted oxidoreductase